MTTAAEELSKGTYDPVGGELREWSYWDTISLLSTTEEFLLFTVPKSGTKKTADTNFPLAGVMPDYQSFATDALKVIVIPDSVLTQANYLLYLAFLEQTTIELSIENKAPMWQFTLAEVMDAADPNVVTGGAVGDQVTDRNIHKGLRPLFVPSVLAANVPFNVRVNLDTASNAAIDGFKVKVIMKGAKKSLN